MENKEEERRQGVIHKLCKSRLNAREENLIWKVVKFWSQVLVSLGFATSACRPLMEEDSSWIRMVEADDTSLSGFDTVNDQRFPEDLLMSRGVLPKRESSSARAAS
mmetsp:Transcript_7217/g.24929  ORF Transcript_7217/g.24929 Transcript_7217/m.24929 type:complete len:106 (-) Transcript_7217:133-450(-)